MNPKICSPDVYATFGTFLVQIGQFIFRLGLQSKHINESNVLHTYVLNVFLAGWCIRYKKYSMKMFFHRFVALIFTLLLAVFKSKSFKYSICCQSLMTFLAVHQKISYFILMKCFGIINAKLTVCTKRDYCNTLKT